MSIADVRRRSRARGATMVEYLVVLGVVALLAIAGFTAFSNDTRQLSATQSQCVNAMSCGEGGSFPSASVGAGSSSGGAASGSSQSGLGKAASAVWSFGKGFVVDGAWGTIKGIGQLAWNVATNPVDTTVGIAKGLAHVAMNPRETASAIADEFKRQWKEDPSRALGNGVFQLASMVVPVSKAGLAGKVAGTADKAADAARAADKAADAARAADKAAGAARKADDAANGCPGGICGVPGGNCFGPGTPVATPEGERAIETLVTGDVVMARDPETGLTAPQRIVQVFITPDHEVLELGLERGDGTTEHLVVTPEHPFWLEGRGFVTVASLAPGDVLETASGTTRVASLMSLPQKITVYNFEVATAHTYFVGNTAAWVHNSCAPKPGDVVRVRRSDGSVSDGKVLGTTPDGRVVVEVKVGDGQVGVKQVDPRDLQVRRPIGDDVMVPRSDGSMSQAKVVERHPDGRVTVEWDAGNGQIASKTVPESALKDVDRSAAAAKKFGEPYRTVDDGYYPQKWFSVYHGTSEVADDGWKLHVSSGMNQSYEVAERVLPMLKDMGVPHKVVTDPAKYAQMSGTQAGKFITIYPENPQQAAQIAREIDRRLGDMKGTAPAVPGERQLGSSGMVSTRYGGFTKSTVTDPRTGREVPDVRGTNGPPWVEDPFTPLGL